MTEEFSAMPNSPPAEDASPQTLPVQKVQEIYRQYGRDVKAFLLGVLKDRESAEDALQQTFQRVAESGGTARSETLRGWLFQVAYREAMLMRRKRQRADRQHRAWWLMIGRGREQAAPDEGLATREEVERLRQAVEQLPPEQRIVVERRIQCQETFAQIAAQLGLPLGTVLTRMRIATQSLRKTLHEE